MGEILLDYSGAVDANFDGSAVGFGGLVQGVGLAKRAFIKINGSFYDLFTAKVSATDLAGGYLGDKVTAGTNISVVTGSDKITINNTYSLPAASASLGGVLSGGDITVDGSGNVTVNNVTGTITKRITLASHFFRG